MLSDLWGFLFRTFFLKLPILNISPEFLFFRRPCTQKKAWLKYVYYPHCKCSSYLGKHCIRFYLTMLNIAGPLFAQYPVVFIQRRIMMKFGSLQAYSESIWQNYNTFQTSYRCECKFSSHSLLQGRIICQVRLNQLFHNLLADISNNRHSRFLGWWPSAGGGETQQRRRRGTIRKLSPGRL